MLSLVDLYGWHTLLTPELLVVAGGVALLYAKAGNIEPNVEGILGSLHWKRQLLFYVAVICMYFGYGGILSVLAKESIDFYVLQLCIRYMCMIPLFIAGTPEWIREGLLLRLPGGRRFLFSERYGLYAGFTFFLTLSVVLFPAVHNMLLELFFLRVLIHMLLLASAWFMWESLLRPDLIRQQRKQNRTKLMMLGSIMLFPICIIMIGSNYEAYHYPQNLLTDLCVSPSSEPLSIAYSIGSTSAFGGMLLMAIQQTSFLLSTRWIKGQQ